jgi:AcrR family transcriptional regulator
MSRPRLAPDTRDRVLDAANALLARHGYRRMTVEHVAREAGIGKGSIYLYFESKDALVLAAIDRIVERVLARLAAIAAGPEPAATRLRRMLLARVLVRFDGAQEHSRSLDEILAALRPALLARRRRHFAREAAILTKVLREGASDGSLCASRPRQTAETLVLATNALLPYSLSARELGQRSAVARGAGRIATVLLSGLETRSRTDENESDSNRRRPDAARRVRPGAV